MLGGIFRDLLLPTTDAAVFVQLAVAVTVFGAGFWWARHNRDLLLFIGGLATLTAAFMAVRTVH